MDSIRSHFEILGTPFVPDLVKEVALDLFVQDTFSYSVKVLFGLDASHLVAFEWDDLDEGNSARLVQVMN